MAGTQFFVFFQKIGKIHQILSCGQQITYLVVLFFSQNATPLFVPVEYTRFCGICVETVLVAKVAIQNTLEFNNN